MVVRWIRESRVGKAVMEKINSGCNPTSIHETCKFLSNLLPKISLEHFSLETIDEKGDTCHICVSINGISGVSVLAVDLSD